MEDDLQRVVAENRKKRELLLKRLYYHQVNENPAARVWDMTVIAKELRPEFKISRIELKQHYEYLAGEGLIAHDLPPSPNISNNSTFSRVLGPFFPDTWLTPKGISEAERLIMADKEGLSLTYVAGADTGPVAETHPDSGQVSKRTGNPNRFTENKLGRLIKRRQEVIERTGKAPAWMETCAEIPIDPKTVTANAEELHDKWYDVKFLPKPWKFDAGNWEYLEN